MPVCTHCAYPADYVYTTYKTKSNIRLGVCLRCDQFLDPLIEHPGLVILLDLILLKPRVFLHLLFNMGSPPFDADKGIAIPALDQQRRREYQIRKDMMKLILISAIAETALRVLPHMISSSGVTPAHICAIAGTVFLEGIAQHIVTITLALQALKHRRWYPCDPPEAEKDDAKSDGRQKHFLPTLIPLTILYTSIIPLSLQLLLMIWVTPSQSHLTTTSLFSTLPFIVPQQLLELERALIEAWAHTDKIWIGTRLLGGMSAGFGLRVLLPTKPWETTVIILAGWMSAAFIGQMAERLLVK
ncbi:uncharacterized protein IL334_006710 [Kwoniella shivajii]|uniref:Protein ARV n=1 Tax=Kwoniella shivajii TaxID=564305 RepID=A0ABZ1D726_9TREE|nr:hypothetical protein IL334_006710 [Kwoniella shivajii]